MELALSSRSAGPRYCELSTAAASGAVTFSTTDRPADEVQRIRHVRQRERAGVVAVHQVVKML